MTFATLTASLLLSFQLVRRDLKRAAGDELLPPLKGMWIGRVILFTVMVGLLAPRLWELVT